MGCAATGWSPSAVAAALWDSRLHSLHNLPDPNSRLFNGESRKSLRDAAYKRYLQLQLCYFCVASSTEGNPAGVYLDSKVVRLFTDNVDRQVILAEVMNRHYARSGTQLRCNPRSYESMVDFMARCLTMTNIGKLEAEANPRRSVMWQSGGLRSCLLEHFGTAAAQGHDRVKLCKHFDSWNIEAVGGIKIKFTDNLADHLLLVEDDTAVLVFHHASFLEIQDHKYVMFSHAGSHTIDTSSASPIMAHSLSPNMSSLFLS